MGGDPHRDPTRSYPALPLTLTEFADGLRVSARTVRRQIAAGNIAAARIGRQYRFTREQLERCLQARVNGKN